jgi:hypothetical protein
MKMGWMCPWAFASAVIAGPAQAQLQSQVAEVAGAATSRQFDIAGVRIGMSAADVAAALAAGGYRRNYQGMGPNWDTSVARLAAQRSVRLPGRGEVPSLETYVKGAERVEVQYRPSRAGAVVLEVEYTIVAEAIDQQRFRATLASRFGRPNRSSGVEMLYCSRGERDCTMLNYPNGVQLPTVFVAIGPTLHSIRLRDGGRAWEEYQAALRADVDRRAPRTTRTTF